MYLVLSVCLSVINFCKQDVSTRNSAGDEIPERDIRVTLGGPKVPLDSTDMISY